MFTLQNYIHTLYLTNLTRLIVEIVERMDIKNTLYTLN